MHQLDSLKFLNIFQNSIYFIIYILLPVTSSYLTQHQNLIIKQISMSLLNNLIEFSTYQPTSLLFCTSPKESNDQKFTKDFRGLISARKQQTVTPQRKPSSKSLSKLQLISASAAKIDPRERLLHRMVHKINMKLRKHYLNLFVVLETLKKKDIYLFKAPENEVDSTVKQGIVKLLQIQEIMFSKYYANQMKKECFRGILGYSKNRKAYQIIRKVINKKIIGIGFKEIKAFANLIEKNEIRIDILIHSIQNINKSSLSFNKTQYFKIFFTKLKSQPSKIPAKKSKQPQISSFTSPTKTIQQVKDTQHSSSHSPFSKIKAPQLSYNENYQALKAKQKSNDLSPGKQKQPITIKQQSHKLSLQKRVNFMKSPIIKTNLQESTFKPITNSQPQYKIVKRCEPDRIIKRQTQDLKNISPIFFPIAGTGFESNQGKSISESLVQSLHNNDNISEALSQEIHGNSQLTIISPLSQINFQQSRKSLASSSARSAFGTEAVNFKNSLVQQRQLMKQQGMIEKVKSKKQPSFTKIKNMFKNDKKMNDQYSQNTQSVFRYENRYDSAQKDGNYLSQKIRKDSDFQITIPQTHQGNSIQNRISSFSKRNSDVPQQDYIRGSYNTERKHLSLMSNNKFNCAQQEARRTNTGATYLKIIAKK